MGNILKWFKKSEQSENSDEDSTDDSDSEGLCVDGPVHRPNKKFLTKEDALKNNPETLKQFAFHFCNIARITQGIVTRKALDPTSKDFRNISQLFTHNNKKCFKITKIETVLNPFLLVQYNMKKRVYKIKEVPVKETILFHGVRKSNIDSICKSNFNWRLYGRYINFILLLILFIMG